MKAAALLAARPAPLPPLIAEGARGLHRIDVGASRPAWVRVPPQWQPEHPAPLAIMLHGSGGDPRHGLSMLEPHASEKGAIVVAPASDDYTWDVILGAFGPDVTSIDAALGWVFDRYMVDNRRITIGGFSDGASYALSMAIGNGKLFSHAIAFSPGFIAPAPRQGHARLFITHGRHDTVLPIDHCSRRLVPGLQRADHEVEYLEFDGGHEFPQEIVRAAVQWFLG